MHHDKNIEDAIIVAVKKIANSVKSSSKPDFSKLIEVTSQLSLKNLDSWERLIRWTYSNELREFNHPKWRFWKQKSDYPLTWIDLCSENGFIREKLLQTFCYPAPNSFFFALTLRRLNDWVAQVRNAAYEAIPIIAKKTDPEIIADVLCSILPHWTSWGRIDDKEKQVLLSIASVKDVDSSLKMKIQLRSSGPMTSVLSQIGQIDILDPHLKEISEKAIQPSVRAKAYNSLLEGQMTWSLGREWKWTNKPYGEGYYKPIIHERHLSVTCSFLETLKMAIADRSPIVRRVAGDMLIKHINKIGNEAFSLAHLLASDPSPSVTERGDYALKKLKFTYNKIS